MRGFAPHRQQQQPQHLTDTSEDTIERANGDDADNEFTVMDDGADEVEIRFQPSPNVEVVPDYRSRTNKNKADLAAASPKEEASSRLGGGRRNWNRIISVLIGLSLLLTVILLIVYFVQEKNLSLQKTPTSSEHTGFQGTVTTAELQQSTSSSKNNTNASQTACWLAIHGNVYDLTEYALEHPGGPEYITDFCGTDATRDYAIHHPESLLRTIRARTWLGVYDDNTAEKQQEEDTPDAPEQDENDAPSNEPESQIATEEPPTQEDEMEPEPEEEEPEQDTPEGQEQEATPVPTEEQETPAPEVVCLRQFYNLATVAEHATRDDCWYILYGFVYDLTDFVDRHPGGARSVFNECGTDATQAYEDERWHDRQLLQDEGMSYYIIGEQGDTTGLLPFVCN